MTRLSVISLKRARNCKNIDTLKSAIESFTDVNLIFYEEKNTKKIEKYIESIKLTIEWNADVNVLCDENTKITEQTDNPELLEILKKADIQC